MKINWSNAIVGTILSGLLAWWLWTMGEDTLQRWLLASLGGFIIEVGMIGSMGIFYTHPRSGSQVRIVMSCLAIIAFIACCIYSFFQFSAIGFCIPMGVFVILGVLLASKIYITEM